MHPRVNTRRSHRSHLYLATLLGALAVSQSGCQALTTAQSGVSTATSTAQTTKSTADTTKQLGTDLKGDVDKALGKKTDGTGGAGGAGDKPEDEDGKRIQSKVSKPNQPVNDELSAANND